MIRGRDSTNQQADLRPNHCRSDRARGPLVPNKNSCRSIRDQQRYVRPKQASPRAFSALAMPRDTNCDERKHKNCAKDYSRAEELLPLHLGNPFALVPRKRV